MSIPKMRKIYSVNICIYTLILFTIGGTVNKCFADEKEISLARFILRQWLKWQSTCLASVRPKFKPQCHQRRKYSRCFKYDIFDTPPPSTTGKTIRRLKVKYKNENIIVGLFLLLVFILFFAVLQFEL
jgi:hypothetical protein